MKLTVLENEEGDWETLYKDGEKIMETHSLDWKHVLEALGIPLERIEMRGYEDLPLMLKDLDPSWVIPEEEP